MLLGCEVGWGGVHCHGTIGGPLRMQRPLHCFPERSNNTASRNKPRKGPLHVMLATAAAQQQLSTCHSSSSCL